MFQIRKHFLALYFIEAILFLLYTNLNTGILAQFLSAAAVP